MIKQGAGKPFLILIIFMALSCLYFWTSSRYPELSGKAVMGDHPSLSGLGFHPLITIEEDFSFAKKVGAETINWIDTNKRGMSFAFVIGAFFLSILPLLKTRSFKNGFGDSIFGMALGTPLGVCVNCAAPIARALHGGGASLQTSLATLISSPTFNIVVLTMAFAMFPFYAVILKIMLTVFFILVVIPLSCRYIFKKEVEVQKSVEIDQNANDCPINISNWQQAVLWAVKSYFKNLLYIIKIALPLMLLAGFLGSLLVVSSPWSMMGNVDQEFPFYQIVLILFILAIFGTLLPAPMSFDVILSASLLHSGIPIQYATTLLFTLGSFSIYAHLIVWRSISLRMANFLFLCTALIGICMGMACMFIDKITLDETYSTTESKIDDTPKAAPKIEENTPLKEILGTNFDLATSENSYDPITERTDQVFSYRELKDELEEHKISFTSLPKEKITNNSDSLIIEQHNLAPKNNIGDKLYESISSSKLGIIQPYNISYITALIEAVPLTTMSVAVDDVHKDGWADILVTGDLEIRPNLILYTNIGGKKFKRQYVPIPDAINEVVLVSLADLNGDTWPDIIFATYDGPSYVIYNEEGDFQDKNLHVLNDGSAGTTMSLSIDDIEADGNLDIFLGNWSVGPRFINFEKSRNALLKINKDGIERHDLAGMTGETLSSMFTDFNNDGIKDIYIGNDFMQDDYSDKIMLGNKSGMLELLGEQDKLKNFAGGQSTMSIDIGDIDNDNLSDFFIGQIAYTDLFENEMSKVRDKQIPLLEFCDKSSFKYNKENCEREILFKEAIAKSASFITDACRNLKDEKNRKMCSTHSISYNYVCDVDRSRVIRMRGFKDKASARYKDFCALRTKALKLEANKASRKHLLESENLSQYNILLKSIPNSSGLEYKSEATKRNVAYGAWTWNARFADLDNDTWQDIYMVNGSTIDLVYTTNLFYKNKGDGNFEEQTTKSGLEDFSVTSSFSFADFDNDGDLDIITIPTDAPIQYYNNNTDNVSIQLIIQDNTSANTQALGSKVTISYKKDGVEKRQTRWINHGGGFKSYNQPIIHFGMEDIDVVDKITIHWRDGHESQIEGLFETNNRYKISRM